VDDSGLDASAVEDANKVSIDANDVKLEISKSDEQKKELNEFVGENIANNASVCQMYCNCIKFYGRFLMCLYSGNKKLGRPFKALVLCMQLTVVCTFVSALVAYTDKRVAWEAADGQQYGLIMVVFAMMRVFQPLISLTMKRDKSASSDVIAVAGGFALALMYLLGQIFIYLSMEMVSVNQRTLIYRNTLTVVALELILWDALVMPLVFATIGKISSAFIKQFPALQI